MKMRRPAVRVEDERGNPVSFFQLKEMAELEARKQGRPKAKPAVVTDEIEGPPTQHKRFRVWRDPHGSDILASFNTLEERLQILGAGAPIGAMSFTTIGRSYGPQVEPKVDWTALPAAKS
jgi:hypothetical protein